MELNKIEKSNLMFYLDGMLKCYNEEATEVCPTDLDKRAYLAGYAGAFDLVAKEATATNNTFIFINFINGIRDGIDHIINSGYIDDKRLDERRRG